jgi:hypothetical protein
VQLEPERASTKETTPYTIRVCPCCGSDDIEIDED